MQLNKIKNDYKQYGAISFLKRTIKYFLRMLGIKYDSYLFMTKVLDYDALLQQWLNNPITNVLSLSVGDYEKGDPAVFTKEKINVLQKQLNSGCLAYGVMDGDRLLFSCMLSFYSLYTSSPIVHDTLQNEECLLFDAYCIPQERGKKLHSRMLTYRLLQGCKCGKKESVTIVLRDNRASYRSLKRVGFKINFNYYVLVIGKKVYTNYYNKRNIYDCK